MKNLKGKIALITGSTRGIGKAIALELASQGAIVLLHGSKKSRHAQSTLEKIQKISSKSKIYFANIGRFDEVSTMIQTIEHEFTSLDILINNAGIAKSSTVVNMTNEAWDDVLKVNVYGTFYVTKLCIPLLQGVKQGKIINISSVYGFTGEYGQANYSTSKAAIIGFTKAVAKEMAKYNITVNAVCPGLIDTGLIGDIPGKYLKQRITKIPLGRVGKKEEVAKLAAFLCSDDADYITGQAISINGGMY